MASARETTLLGSFVRTPGPTEAAASAMQSGQTVGNIARPGAAASSNVQDPGQQTASPKPTPTFTDDEMEAARTVLGQWAQGDRAGGTENDLFAQMMDLARYLAIDVPKCVAYMLRNYENWARTQPATRPSFIALVIRVLAWVAKRGGNPTVKQLNKTGREFLRLLSEAETALGLRLEKAANLGPHEVNIQRMAVIFPGLFTNLIHSSNENVVRAGVLWSTADTATAMLPNALLWPGACAVFPLDSTESMDMQYCLHMFAFDALLWPGLHKSADSAKVQWVNVVKFYKTQKTQGHLTNDQRLAVMSQIGVNHRLAFKTVPSGSWITSVKYDLTWSLTTARD